MIQNDHSEHIARIVGLGLDHKDGHVRITRGDNFDIYFGSEETHEKMQEACIKINEHLSREGKRLIDLSRKEFIELVTHLE